MANNVISASDPNAKSQKPSNSAFKQQKLPAWQPILTAGTVLPTFFFIGIAFIPIGIGLLVTSHRVQEISIDYTYCNKTETTIRCADVVHNSNGSESCECRIAFKIKSIMKNDVFIYYGLNNFYQNHRRYVKSRDDRQLLGDLSRKLSSECDPFSYYKDPNDPAKESPIAPCGAISNSLFNDTFRLLRGKSTPANPVHTREVPLIRTGIAWATDKHAKFRNPAVNLQEAFKNTVKPPNWPRPIWNMSSNPNEEQGFRYEPLIVWMRTAALPTFRKIYGRIAHNYHDNIPEYGAGLPAGDYEMVINYSFPVTVFKGTKKFIISNTSWMGGRNHFLGISYIIVGCICLIMSAIFLFIHKTYGKSTNEILNVTPRTPFTG